MKEMIALEILRNDNVFDHEYLAWNKYIKIEEAIEELEEAMKPKSCKWKYDNGGGFYDSWNGDCGVKWSNPKECKKGEEMKTWSKTYIKNVSTREKAVEEFIRLYGESERGIDLINAIFDNFEMSDTEYKDFIDSVDEDWL